MSVFETVGICGGIPLFLAEHLFKLRQACGRAGLPIDLAVLDEIGPLIAGSGLRDGVARVYVTAGDGGPRDAVEASRLYATIEPRCPLPESEYRRGWRVALAEAEPGVHLRGLKTGNYWANIDAVASARDAGCDESILLSRDGYLVSAAMANVFVVCGGEIFTPPEHDGARAGVVRDWVMGRRPVTCSRIGRGMLTQADEVFLTNSWIGVMPVVAAGERSLPAREQGDGLSAEYARLFG